MPQFNAVLKAAYTRSLQWAPVLAVTVATIAIWLAISFSAQPLLEAHGFRQTQTALTSYWMIQEGWRLAYQTPVGGYPWSIPFEFPIFQSFAALIAWAGDLPLDPVGRLLSFAFLLACAWPAFATARRLDLPSDAAWAFCALLWSSPIYLFWGRTFMIETAAIFLVFAAIPYGLDIRDLGVRWRSVVLFAVFSTLAMLQKVTTAAPVLLAMSFVLLYTHIKNCGLQMPSWHQAVRAIVAFGMPILIAVLWIRYSDLVKSENSFGAELSSKAIATWGMGTVEQRLELGTLRVILWDRILVDNAAGFVGVTLLGGSIITGSRHVKTIVLTCLSLFLLPILMFTNLHYVHDYYQVSSVLFLVGALAVACAVWTHGIIRHPATAPAITLLLVAANLYHFNFGYANNMRMSIESSRSTTLAVSDVIRRHTREGSGIVVFGADWSSEITYYSQRKSFTVPVWFTGYEAAWENPGSFLGDKELGAIVFCESRNGPKLPEIVKRPDVKRQPKLVKVANCYIWLPDVASLIELKKTGLIR
jgi:hypothetical protein